MVRKWTSYIFSLITLLALSVSLPAAEDHDHEHPTKGPNGGALVELGDEEYHAEVLLKDKTNVQPEITTLKMKGIQFVACENTLKQQKLEKSQIVTESGFVPVGIAEIVTKQEEGWAYIKAGF